MPHLIILYYFLALVIGVGSLIVLTIISYQTRNKKLIYFGIFYLTFSLLILHFLLLSYLKLHLNSVFFKYFNIFFLLQFIYETFLIIWMVIFINEICEIKKKYFINSVAGLFGLGFFIYHLALLFNEEVYRWFSHTQPPGISFFFITKDLIPFLSLLYTIIIGIVYHFRTKNVRHKKIIQLLFIVILLFIPGLIFDSVKNTWENLYFFPAFYTFLSIFFLYIVIRYYFQNYNLSEKDLNRLVKQENNKQNGGLHKFCKKNSISEREMDVIKLLLKGYTNQKTADTLFISLSTVKVHIYNIFKKTGVKTRHELTYRILHQK